MKIAQIAPGWFPVPPKNYGGTEVVIYNLIEELVEQGHDVTLYAPGDARTSAKLVSFFPQSLIGSGVPWQAHLKAYYHLRKSVEAVKQGDFDIVHMHLSSASDLYLFPLMAGMQVPHVMTLHSRFPFDHLPNGWVGDADPLYMTEWAASMPMVAISKHARDEVPYPLHFVGVVYHGLPMDTFIPTRTKRRDYFAWLGRCVPDKGAHLAIQAAKEAGIALILAGTVDRNMPESVRYFQEQIKPQIDNQQIRYIGPANMKEKINLFSGARAFLNPIEWEEPFGMVMIEAMALGCPAISFERGAAPELIVDGKTGFLVEDVDAMVRAIASIDTINRDTTRQHIEEHFSARVMAKNYTQIYQQVIEASAGAKGWNCFQTAS
ncbi:MAG TPA: glycosyltransferase family 4 protein [Ktedonobacteraceae bacterium]|nr:glycosyltransferase family 4 protein [Ktedonobacteraceae bacterium]